MKKTLFLALALLLSAAVFAQNREMFVNESFNGSGMPEGWTISGMGVGNWSISSTNKAGGEANELMLYWNPNFNGISRVITTPVNLTGIDNVVVSLKHCLDNYQGPHTIGVATSSDNGTTWNTGWSQSYDISEAYTVQEVITTPDMGKENVLFCIYYEGNSYNINNWYFDDIIIFSQENLDLQLVSIDVPSVVNAGQLDVKFTVKNLGVETIESFTIESVDISSDDDCGTMEPETFETNLAPFETAQFTMGVTFNLNPGTYSLPISVVQVNGIADDDMSNNNLNKTFNAAMGSTQRIPMIEHFSSSSCGPCVSVNYNMSQLTANNPGKYTYVKYPMYWPSPGDPYYTDEGGVRQTYYGCNAVPQTFLDGTDQGFTNVSQESLDAQYNTLAFANIRGAYTIQGNTINIIADFMSYVNLTDVRAFVSINEKTTTGNIGGNGESEFHHIMLKMMENAGGNVISINAGEYQRLEFSYDMSTTFMEDINDLEVSLWLQDHASKEIYNSHFAYENSEHCYPVQNMTAQFNEEGTKILLAWEAPEANTPTAYNIYIKGELVEENYTGLAYENTELAAELYSQGVDHVAEVVALYADDKSSVGVAKTFSSGVNVNEIKLDEVSCDIYPNPAKDFVKVQSSNIVKYVKIFNTLGMLVEEIEVDAFEVEINTSRYNSGIYFISLETESGNITKKIVVE